MPRLRFWIGLLASCAAVLPAFGQSQLVHYSPRQEIPVANLPLTVSIAGLGEPGIQRAWRMDGTIEGASVPSVTRYEALIRYGGYFGLLFFMDTTHDVVWHPPTPEATLQEWPLFQNNPVARGRTGSIVNGQMTIAYLLARVDEPDPKSCALFSGAALHSELRGYLCAAQDSPLEVAPQFIAALGHPGLFSPQPVTLPELSFGNEFGGFTTDGREYVIAVRPGSPTPAPWCNVLANDRFGCLVSESALGCTWSLS